MPIDRPPRELAFTPLFTVRLDPDTRHLTIPEFAKMLADAKFPHMQDELTYDAAVELDATLQDEPNYVHFAGLPPNPSNVALQRECAEVSYMAEMQFAVRDSRMRIFSRLTSRPYAVRFEKNRHWQDEVNRQIVPIDDLIGYAEHCLVKVDFSASCGQVQPQPPVIDAALESRPNSLRERGKAATAAKHQLWIEDAKAIRAERPGISVMQIAIQLFRRYRASRGQAGAPEVNTIRNVIRGKV